MSKRSKKFRVFDTYTTYFLPVGWSLMCCLCWGLCIYFFIHFILDLKDPEGWACILIILLPNTGVNIYFFKTKVLRRFYIRYQFRPTGIHCSGFTWGRFTIPWEEIHTYGFFVSAGSYLYYPMLFFSLVPHEQWLKNPLTMNRERFLLQYREKVWQELCLYLPADMKKHLQDSIDHQRAGFFKR